MKKRVLMIACMAFCSGISICLAEEEARTYRAEMMVLAVEGAEASELTVTSRTGAARCLVDPVDQVGAYSSVSSLSLGKVELDLSGEQVLFNGLPDPPAGTGIELLSAPRILVKEGIEATVRSGAEMQYFESREDGCYVLHTTTLSQDGQPGLRLEFRILPADLTENGLDHVMVELGLDIATVVGREEIPGLTLDVGRPTISTVGLTSCALVPLLQWNLISGHLIMDDISGRPAILLVLLRIDRKS